MENPEFDPRAINQFFSIGAILLDMRINPNMQLDDEFIEFIDLEYDRIELKLTDIWKDKPTGLTYVLQSHWVEADRLYTMVLEEQDRKRGFSVFYNIN
nr:hypothetical protein [Pedobacter panaciterrae]